MEAAHDLLLGKPLWMWGVFMGTVVVLLALDLGVFHRKSREIGVTESLALSAFYIAIALIFAGFVWHNLGPVSAKEYITGYLIEKTLAIDNIFVISLVFAYFAVPLKYQHRVLFWGILGVIVLRAIMIGAGIALISQFEWVLYIFAAFLIGTGVKMLTMSDGHTDIGGNPILRFLYRHLRVSPEQHGERFVVRKKNATTGRLETWVTPLFVALIFIEIIDIVFAIDSVPAIFAITLDPFIVYTSNIFAILGLRALYFALAAVIDRFVYLKQALALVLVFIGSKIFVAHFADIDKVPPSISLGVTVTLITGGILYSLWRTRKPAIGG